MKKYTNIITSKSGDALSGMTVKVLNQDGTTATIYSDNGATQIPLGFVTTDGMGAFSFYAANGRYNLRVSGAGINTYTLSDELIYDPHDDESSLSGKVNAVDLASTNSGKGIDLVGDGIRASLFADTGAGHGADLVANAAKKVASIAALRALRVPQGSDAQTVIVDGQVEPMVWNATSTATDDGGITFMPNSLTSGQPGRWVRQFKSISVKDYGAKVDGATDDTTAITDALANQVVSLGNGTSKISSLTTNAGNVLLGQPQVKSGAALASASVLTASGATALTLGGQNNTVRGVSINPVTTKVAGSIGLTGLDKYHTTLEDILINGYDIGIRQEKSLYQTYRRVDVSGCNNGVLFAAATGTWNIDWYNNEIVIEQCRFMSNSQYNLDCQVQGLKATACDFSGPGANYAAVRVRAGSKDACFEDCYIESIPAGANAYQIEGGVVRIKGGFVQGGAQATPANSIIKASGGAVVIVDGLTGQDYFTNLIQADGSGTLVILMPGCFSGQPIGHTNFSSLTNGASLIDLSGFNPITKVDTSNFISQSASIAASTGTFTYQLSSSQSINFRAALVLNGGFNDAIIQGAAHWVNGGNGVVTSTSSNASVTVSVNSSGLLTITNAIAYGGTINFNAQLI